MNVESFLSYCRTFSEKENPFERIVNKDMVDQWMHV